MIAARRADRGDKLISQPFPDGFGALAAGVLWQACRDIRGLDQAGDNRKLDALIWFTSPACQLILECLGLGDDLPLRWLASGGYKRLGGRQGDIGD